MSKLERNVLRFAIVFIMVGVILGALGAHALAPHLSAQKLASFETGVRYQLLHGVGLISLLAISGKLDFSLKRVYILIIIGVICFSFSIYVLSMQELMKVKLGFVFGPITPIGGLLMIIGWGILLLKLMNFKKNKI